MSSQKGKKQLPSPFNRRHPPQRGRVLPRPFLFTAAPSSAALSTSAPCPHAACPRRGHVVGRTLLGRPLHKSPIRPWRRGRTLLGRALPRAAPPPTTCAPRYNAGTTDNTCVANERQRVCSTPGWRRRIVQGTHPPPRPEDASRPSPHRRGEPRRPQAPSAMRTTLPSHLDKQKEQEIRQICDCAHLLKVTVESHRGEGKGREGAARWLLPLLPSPQLLGALVLILEPFLLPIACVL